MSSAEVFKIFSNDILDYFLPRFCSSCSTKLLSNENTICFNCLSKIQIAEQPRLAHEFNRKFADANIIADFFAMFVFEKDKELQHAIHSLKYENKFPIGVYLGSLLAEKILISKTVWKIDLIIPIPLHHLKKAERGYNQSLYIAKGLSKVLHCRFSDRIIKRIKYTESQTGMNLKERQKNMLEAFKIRNKKTIQGKTILLVDDVITTGATISECGKILLESGAQKVYAASIAIAD